MSFRPLSENYVASVTLPSSVAPISAPSKAIERLLSKRENDHNSTLKAMRLRCKKFNLEIEEEILKEGDSLKESLETIRNEIDISTALVLRVENDEDLLTLRPDLFQTVLSTAEFCNNKRIELVDEFYENVKNLERKRSNYFKSVLNGGYEKTGQISHLLPYDLLCYFENEIVKLNEITMNNYRYYSKVHTDLKLQAQEDLRRINLAVVDARNRFRMALKLSKLKGVMEAHKSHELAVFVDTAKVPTLAFGLQDTQDFFPRTSSEVLAWSQQIEMTLDQLDANAKKLINLYKMAVVHIFHRFFDELNAITEALTEDDATSQTTLDIEYNEFYPDIVQDLTEHYTCDVVVLQKLWNSITGYMESNIKNTNYFLTSSAHLWDPHFARVADFKNLVLQDLKLVIAKNDKVSQNFDKKINVTLDKLREESTISKLNQHLKSANKFLDSVGKLYSTQCDSEIKILKKYRTFVDKEIDLLISEIDRFLEENANSANIKEKKSNWTNVFNQEEPKEDSNEQLIPHQMKACQYQVDAVNNWMFGLWETIRSYMLNCREELSGQAETWMDNTATKLKKRLEVRLATHRPRYLRIKTMIHDVRLKEVQEHLDAFRKLEGKVQQYIVDARYCNQFCKEDRVTIVEEYEVRMKEIEERLKKATRSQHVAACIEMSKTIARETIDKMDEHFQKNYELLEENKNNIQKAICNFGDAIKLFVDGGTHSRNEAKLFKKKIAKLRQGVPKKYKKIFDEYNAIKPDTFHKFNQTEAAILARLDLSKKEFEHNEKVCEKIKFLKDEIRKFAYDVRFKIHRIDACVDYYAEMSQIGIWKRKHFDVMKEAVRDCLVKITDLTDFLIGDAKTVSGGYIYNLFRMIDASYKEIEKMAKSFYETHGPIINKGKIQANFNDFMKEVKKNYDGFKAQVEIHCLESVGDLIKHVLKLIKINDEIYENLIEKFPNIKRNGSEENDLCSKLSQESVNLEERKMFLEGSKSNEKLAENPAVEEIILKNDDRVNTLHHCIVRLMDCVYVKVNIMEKCVYVNEDEEEENVSERIVEMNQ